MQAQGIDVRQEVRQGQMVRASRASRQLAEQYAHAERFGQAAHGAAQLTMAEQAEGLAFQFDDREIQQAELLGLLPAPSTYRRVVVRQSRGQGKQEHQT